VQDQSTSPERSFESAFAELEEVVCQLEEGELSLEEAISLYERGQALSRFCQDRLDRAELRVTQLASDPALPVAQEDVLGADAAHSGPAGVGGAQCADDATC
jgi:exodeoxyribonuclease VII small subunit